MSYIIKHLKSLVSMYQLIAELPTLGDEDRYWKLFRIKYSINWIRTELGYEPVKFIRGTNKMIIDDIMK